MGITGQQIGAELKRAGRPYPERPKQAAVAYAREARGRGVALQRIADELGISPVTLTSWLGGSALRRVEIVADESTVRGECVSRDEAPRNLVAMDTRSGIRIEGLD